MSKIIEHAEKNENAEMICADCAGQFQQVADNSSAGLFRRKVYQKWFWLCNRCGFKSKTHCAKFNKEMKK